MLYYQIIKNNIEKGRKKIKIYEKYEERHIYRQAFRQRMRVSVCLVNGWKKTLLLIQPNIAFSKIERTNDFYLMYWNKSNNKGKLEVKNSSST